MPTIGASTGPLSRRFKWNPRNLGFFRFRRILADSHENATTLVAVDGNEANVTPRYGGGVKKTKTNEDFPVMLVSGDFPRNQDDGEIFTCFPSFSPPPPYLGVTFASFPSTATDVAAFA